MWENHASGGSCVLRVARTSELTGKSNWAISDCTIQSPIWQSVIAKSLPQDLQLPPEKLFSQLSHTHFVLIMGLENLLTRVFYELETVKKAIAAVKEGRTFLSASEISTDRSPIAFRPEHTEVIEGKV